jgi:hypothetical protein
VDEVTHGKLHRIPYMWMGPGVSQALLTKPQKNGSAAQVLWGTYGRCDNLFFFRKERQGALANTTSPTVTFRGNDIDALLFLLFKRFSAVFQTKFFGKFFFRNFNFFKKKNDKNIPVSHTLAVIRVSKLKNENTSKMHM